MSASFSGAQVSMGSQPPTYSQAMAAPGPPSYAQAGPPPPPYDPNTQQRIMPAPPMMSFPQQFQTLQPHVPNMPVPGPIHYAYPIIPQIPFVPPSGPMQVHATMQPFTPSSMPGGVIHQPPPNFVNGSALTFPSHTVIDGRLHTPAPGPFPGTVQALTIPGAAHPGPFIVYQQH